MIIHRAAPLLTDDFREDVIAGLARTPKQLPSKYFYDATGSCLFDQITKLEEYYPTRTELAIMRAHAREMAARCGPDCVLIELGAGSLVKARLLLDALDRPAAYVPVDVSGDHLEGSARNLAADYPNVVIHPIVEDFTHPFSLPSLSSERRVVYFPGSTIGNFDRAEVTALMRRLSRLVGPEGGILLGVDLQKDVSALEAAYNDNRGVTAAFNRNLLVRINRELEADFDVDAFRHHAFYNQQHKRIEMHLVSTAAQRVRVGDRSFTFAAGETIHTENSYKYDCRDLARQSRRWNLRVEATWMDANNYFAVLFLKPTRNTPRENPRESDLERRRSGRFD